MPNQALIQHFPTLSRILAILQVGEVNQFTKRKKIDAIINESGLEESTVFSILSFLLIFGFIEIGDENDILITSKYPNLAISAIRERLDLAIPVPHKLRDSEKKRFFREFTKNLEVVRNELHGEEKPIHAREMVNVIIKGKQIKEWKFRDVYLHILHPEWNEYHLIGIGERGENSIETLAHKAMKQRLDLESIDYEIDPNINPPAIEFIAISKSQGALTHYKIHTRVIKKLNLDLNKHLEQLIRKDERFSNNSFKWLTCPHCLVLPHFM